MNLLGRPTKRLQWVAGFRFCWLLDARGPPPLKRIVELNRFAERLGDA
jgi:hypothetical protein